MAKYTLKRKTVPVTIEDENGVDQEYELREMNGQDRDAFLSLASSKIIFGPNGKPTGAKDSAGLVIDILSRTLFDKEGRAVSKDTLKKWPGEMLDSLSTEAQLLCGLRDEGEKEEAPAAGND